MVRIPGDDASLADAGRAYWCNLPDELKRFGLPGSLHDPVMVVVGKFSLAIEAMGVRSSLIGAPFPTEDKLGVEITVTGFGRHLTDEAFKELHRRLTEHSPNVTVDRAPVPGGVLIKIGEPCSAD